MNRTVISAGALGLLFLLAVLAVYVYQLPVATWVVLASAVAVLLILFLLVRRSIRPRITRA